jgi:hypothetical protein
VKYLSNIFNAIIRAAQNKWVWLRVLILVITGFAGAILFSRTKVDTKAAESCESERGQLIQALIEIRTELDPVQPTSYIDRPDAFIFAIYDTTRPEQMQQRKVNRVLSKIDSILLKYRIDSIKKSKA